MADIDVIAAEIIGEAKEEAAKIVSEARKKADGVLSAAKSEADGLAQKRLAAARASAEAIISAGAGSIEQKRRQALLAAKQAVIADTLQAAQRRAADLPEAEYFALLANIAVERAKKGEGELRFGSADLARKPADFGDTLAGALPVGVNVRVSDTAAPFENGFVIVYDGAEENCSIAALFRDKREAMTDAVGKLLFR